MLGMGPILWREANRIMHSNPRASGPDPVTRIEAAVVDDPFTSNPKYRYRSPAAWYYYQQIDEINRRAPTVSTEHSK